MSPPTLGYWDIRGICEPIRFVFHQAGADFEDKRYPIGEAPDYAGVKVWFGHDMHILGLDFPNMPYYIDGDLKVTQSLTILRHVARQHGLLGKPQDIPRIEMAEQAAVEVRTSLVKVIHGEEKYEELKAKLRETVPAQLDKFTKFLGDGHFVAGDYVTYADFLWYETLDAHGHFQPGLLDRYDVIRAYLKRIEELPNIAKYMASPKYTKIFASPFAKWGNKLSEVA
ncbi:Glutathione S-transferase Mu 3 [Halotydeus destructor]|nr:Glutathione S-transferase Mu 3 [Halotydeus destructor]